MPYTTVVAGTTITASWANANVRDQVVTPFATDAARASAIISPVGGMLSWLADTRRFEGYDPTGAKWTGLPGQIVAYGQRDSSSSTTTGEAGVLRLSASLTIGHAYWVVTNSLNLASNTTGDTVQGRLRHTTDGSIPSTSSTILHSSADTQAGFNSEATPILAKFIASANLSLGVLLTVARVGGTGLVSIPVSSSYPSIDVLVIDMGVAPANSGIAIP